MEIVNQYPLEPNTVLALPRTAQPLTAQCQGGVPLLWVRLDPAQPTVARRFRCVPTGAPFDGARILGYIATFQFPDGVVVHVFEVM